MLNTAIIRTVDFCAHRRWIVICGGLILAAGAAAYAITNFSITTNIEALISQNLPWHQRQHAFVREFPQQGISAVIEAPTFENATQATKLLAQELAKAPELFRGIRQPDSGDFFVATDCCFNRCLSSRTLAASRNLNP
jgi:uncharacterized protein